MTMLPALQTRRRGASRRGAGAARIAPRAPLRGAPGDAGCRARAGLPGSVPGGDPRRRRERDGVVGHPGGDRGRGRLQAAGCGGGGRGGGRRWCGGVVGADGRARGRSGKSGCRCGCLVAVRGRVKSSALAAPLATTATTACCHSSEQASPVAGTAMARAASDGPAVLTNRVGLPRTPFLPAPRAPPPLRYRNHPQP